ncbi:MAG TPA: ATP-dependent Clp protease ATP-binding subunit [bacterium]|nr:ATP-dependent Clp protease ATP-binding subunit [bacterium]
MFERFTRRVRTIIDLARKKAVNYGNNEIEPEHIFLAMIEEGQGVGISILHHFGVDLNKVKNEIERYMKIGIVSYVRELPLSQQSKKVLELSFREAQFLGHNYIGTEHLLLGLVADTETIPSKILRRDGISLDRLRRTFEQMLTDGGQLAAENSFGENRYRQQYSTGRKSKTPALDTFGKDLTKEVLEGKLDPVIGREKEILRVIQILCRRKKNNPVLLGDPGVGKTAIVEGLSHMIASGKAPDILKDKRIIMLDLPSMVAGTKYRGEFEQRVKTVLDEIKNSNNIIIFIDELHTLVGAGGAEGAIDASNILKPPLSRGEIQCIGATTLDEYRKYIEKDGALERRFQPVFVSPPTVSETIDILNGLKGKYEAHHNLKITDETIETAVKLSEKYINGRNLPDKAIDLLDEAMSQLRVKLFNPPEEIEKLEKEITEVTKKKEEAINKQNYEKAAIIRDNERELKNKLDYLKENWQKLIPEEKRIVTPESIADVVSQWTGIPVYKLRKEEKDKLLEIESAIHKKVIGQQEAISAISRAIRRSRAGLKDSRKPIGSFLFLGPTGVGKTLLARVLAEFLFGDEQALIQIDMSEYMEKFSVSRLIGAPPGYVGYEEGGQLTEKVRRRPYSVILLDEIEKAHPDVFNLFLQVLEDGRLTDSFGRSVDFKNTILIMTSNIGTNVFKNKAIIGFGEQEDEISFSSLKEQIMERVKKTFRPEFLNRLDEIVIFHPLEKEHLYSILEIELKEVEERLKENNISIVLTDEAKNFLIEKGTNPEFGARPLRRTISRYLEDPLSEEILKDKFPPDLVVIVYRKGEQLSFRLQKKGEKFEENHNSASVIPT